MKEDITVYECKDGRTRAHVKGSKKVVSYPRLIAEEKLGRPLEANEQVHHIDGDPLNNDPNNLEVLFIGEHQRFHNPVRYFDKTEVCAWCKKEFMWTAKQQSEHYRNLNRKDRIDKMFKQPFCSKSCAGKFGREYQLFKQNL